MSCKLFKASRKYIELKGWRYIGYLVAPDAELAVYHDGKRYHVSLVKEGWHEPDLLVEEVDRMILSCRDIIFDDGEHGSGVVVFSVIMLDFADGHVMVKHGFGKEDDHD